ncbi:MULTISPECIES: DUF2334 domain-containing protein [Sphingobium]|jgi:predicted deacetylase|uniref:DUF2334 domain-containing protein n=2 Tax=Sphingobium TaxID=165695 RepID=A0A177JU87_SPHYA|nr:MULTISPECIES: polysaccharide deacetylase family protein [Sphingobium]AYO78736.1 DUF2334 domain-containing protein [Sphingobium yanoikuyae]KZC75403.1 polysaccharide deacetylase [Sphingobium yanoikuyae]MDG2513891.1 polysaccharide deacetylase family protein [Sphingobium yanoikuyae]MDV3481538.1 polysaccharide deacetylase family protein [Sphingobium yanoikuyae]OAH44437.1 polysaccharide deacetylase [Sphingobium yanoikuyae]|tara:strand:+ start:8827 stop:9570 length:744 start_codon:yes stop_codon:yes gene_type:complete
MKEKRLLFSIHDVGPAFEGQVDRLVDHVAPYVRLDRTAMLVVPNHWGDHPISARSPFAGRVRRWAESGAEIFLHGWFHRDGASHGGLGARFKAQHMTAGEGEFLGLDLATARQRLADGRALIEEITGQPIAGFVAPAWLYGEPALTALEELGFPIAEDHMKIWSPMTGQTLARGPVMTWASRSKLRMASSLAVAYLLPPLLHRSENFRVAVHPGDTTQPAIMLSINDVLQRAVLTRRPSRYGHLLDD